MAFSVETSGSAIDELKAALGPLRNADLDTYLTSIAGMIQGIENLTRDAPGKPGWSKLVNVTDTPDEDLDWLGQFSGVRPVGGLTPTQKRARIVAHDGYKRGTPGALRAAAQNFLTGTKTVNIFERDTSPYHFTVNTYDSESGDDNATVNLINNGGFEIDLAWWDPGASISATRDTTKSKYGSASQKVVCATGNNYPYIVVNLSGATAGRVYTASVWVDVTGIPSSRPVGLIFKESGGAFADDQAVAMADHSISGWQRLTVTRTIIRNDRPYLIVHLQSLTALAGDTFWIDGVQVELRGAATAYVDTDTYPMARPVSSSITRNLITNSGFETNVTGWFNNGGAAVISRDATVFRSGSASLKIVCSAAASDGCAFTNLPVVAGQTYVGTARVLAPLGAAMAIGIFDSQTPFGATAVAFTGTGAWQNVVVARTIGGGSTTASLLIYHNTTGAINFWVDEVQFELGSIPTAYIPTNGAVVDRLNHGPIYDALVAQKPAGLVMVYSITPGQTYSQLKANYATYTLVKAHYATYLALRNDT